jgi:steroid delta-isomerase-like uncharacterized protein
MGVEENKRLICRYFEEAFNTGDDSKFEQFFSPDFIDHNSFPGQAPGPEGVLDSYRMWCGAFPNSRGTINDMVAENDRVVVRTTLDATHLGPFSGIQPTHKRIQLGAISIFRVVDGRIVERWGFTEAAGLREKLLDGDQRGRVGWLKKRQ